MISLVAAAVLCGPVQYAALCGSQDLPEVRRAESSFAAWQRTRPVYTYPAPATTYYRAPVARPTYYRAAPAYYAAPVCVGGVCR